MPDYIFLDNWVLKDYMKEDKQSLLSQFIHTNNYTILVSRFSFVELYNPGWEGAPEREDRALKAARFLCQHPCVIVHPQNVFRAEFQMYTAKLENIPIEIDLEALSEEQRLSDIVKILRRDETLLREGIDI